MFMKKITTAAASGLLAVSPIAAQAQTAPVTAALSNVTSQADFMSLAFSMMANPCTSGSQGCVLPLKAAPAPVAEPTPPPPVQEAAAPAIEVAEESGGFSFLPLLLGLGALVGGILIISGGDDDDTPASP